MGFLKQMAGTQKWWRRKQGCPDIPGSDTSSELGAGWPPPGWDAFPQPNANDFPCFDAVKGQSPDTNGDVLMNNASNTSGAINTPASHHRSTAGLRDDGQVVMIYPALADNAWTLRI